MKEGGDQSRRDRTERHHHHHHHDEISVPFVCLVTGNSPLDQVDALNFFAHCGENEELFSSDFASNQCVFNATFIDSNGPPSYSRKIRYYPILSISSYAQPATNVYNCSTMIVNKPTIELGDLNCNIDSISQVYKSSTTTTTTKNHFQSNLENTEEEDEDKGMACPKCALGTEKCSIKANVFRLNFIKERSLNDSILIINSKSVCETQHFENVKTESQFIQCTQELDGTPIPLSCGVSSLLYIKRSNFWFSEPERSIAWLFKNCIKVHSSFQSGECIMFAGPDDMISKPIGNRLGWNKENVFTHKKKAVGQFLVSIPSSYSLNQFSGDNDWHFVFLNLLLLSQPPPKI